jgi:hypothetical protein
VTTEPVGVTSEGGNTTTFTVKLKSPPNGDVVLTVTSGDSTEGKVSPATLIFMVDNLNV